MAKDRRFLIYLDEVTDARIRLLSYRTQVPLVAIIQKCVERAVDGVEKDLTDETKVLRPATENDLDKLRTMQKQKDIEDEEPK